MILFAPEVKNSKCQTSIIDGMVVVGLDNIECENRI